MALIPGTRLGLYEIVSALGAGGMGEKPRLWSDARFASRGPINRMFDLHPDGERVALGPAEPAPGGARPHHLTLLFNFVDELRRIGAMTQR